MGGKYYEFSNHPPQDGRGHGNVLTVFSDLKIPKDKDNNNVVDSYEIGILSTADYSPFGVQLDGRSESGGQYRYGFNGMLYDTWFSGAESLSGVNPEWSFSGTSGEKDDEFKGEGNSYTTEFRQYDARVGRWLSLDPLMGKFPWQSPYVAFDNNPIYYVDPLGSESEGNGDKGWEKGDKGSRKKDNGDGTVTYDAPNGNLVLPERAKILSTLQDGNNNGKVDYNGKPLQGEFGDVYKFNLDGVEYIAKYDKGIFQGYFDSKNNQYKNPSTHSKHSGTTMSFQGWHDQNPPFESVAIFADLSFNSPFEGISISGQIENPQEGTIEKSLTVSSKTDIFGLPKFKIDYGLGFDFKIKEKTIDAQMYKQFEVSIPLGTIYGLSYYSNSRGEKGFKIGLSQSRGLELCPISITNSTINEK